MEKKLFMLIFNEVENQPRVIVTTTKRPNNFSVKSSGFVTLKMKITSYIF